MLAILLCMHLTVQWYLTLLLLRYGTAGMGALCRFALEYRLTVTVFFGGLASTAGAVSTAESEQYVMEPRGYEALYRLHVSSLVNLVKVRPPIPNLWNAHCYLVVGVHTVPRCQTQYCIYTHGRVGHAAEDAMHACTFPLMSQKNSSTRTSAESLAYTASNCIECYV